MKLKSWVGALKYKKIDNKISTICISETKPQVHKYIPKFFKTANIFLSKIFLLIKGNMNSLKYYCFLTLVIKTSRELCKLATF